MVEVQQVDFKAIVCYNNLMIFLVILHMHILVPCQHSVLPRFCVFLLFGYSFIFFT